MIFFIVSLELQLAPWKYKDEKKKGIIENTAKLLGINESDIDLSREEKINGFNNMLNGVVYEGYRLLEQNYAPFGLPRQVQAALFENNIRLQNVGYFLQDSRDIFANKTKLTGSFRDVTLLTNDLKALCDVIDEFNKKTNPNYTQLGLQSASSAIEKNVQSFVIEPLQKLRIATNFSNSSVESQKKSYYEREDLKQTIITMAKRKVCSDGFQELRTQYNTGTITYDRFLNNVSYTFYENNVNYELHRAGENSLFGASKKAKQPADLP